MKKTIVRFPLCGLLVAAVAVTPTQVRGQEKKDQPAAEKKEPAAGTKKKASPPVHGKVAAVDKTAATITVGQTTIQITSETKLTKAGKPATMDDVAVGEEATATGKKGDDGKFVAKTVRFGPKPEGEAKSGGKAKKAN